MTEEEVIVPQLLRIDPYNSPPVTGVEDAAAPPPAPPTEVRSPVDAPQPSYRFKRMLVAMVAHEVNKAYCEATGDLSQPAWTEAPDWQVESAVAGVAFHRGNKEAGPSASHDNWMAQKIKDGWVVGPVKDAEKKTHPALVPFDQLPHYQQVKDHLFRAVVHAMGELNPE